MTWVVAESVAQMLTTTVVVTIKQDDNSYIISITFSATR